MSNVKRALFLTAFDSPALTTNATDLKEGKMFKQLAIVPVVFVSSSFSATMEQEETVFLDGVLQVPIQIPESDSTETNNSPKVSVKRAFLQTCF